MTTATDILYEWIGKRTEETPALGFQCVAWAKKFCDEMGYPIGAFGGSALHGWQTGSPFDSSWTRVENSPTAVPSEGDIVFLNHMPDGHVAVAFSGCTTDRLVLAEQNAGSGNGDGLGANAITVRTIPYDSHTRGACLGWYTRSTHPLSFRQQAQMLGYWNGQREDDFATRKECSIIAMRAGKLTDDMKVWTGVRPDGEATRSEGYIMLQRATGRNFSFTISRLNDFITRGEMAELSVRL